MAVTHKKAKKSISTKGNGVQAGKMASFGKATMKGDGKKNYQAGAKC